MCGAPQVGGGATDVGAHLAWRCVCLRLTPNAIPVMCDSQPLTLRSAVTHSRRLSPLAERRVPQGVGRCAQGGERGTDL